jgi:hypothetical protein
LTASLLERQEKLMVLAKLGFPMAKQKPSNYQLYEIDYDTSVIVSFLFCIPNLDSPLVSATPLSFVMARLIVQVAHRRLQFYPQWTIYV